MTTEAETTQASTFARAQRASNASLLVIDPTHIGSEEAKALCERVKTAASSNQAEYEKLLQTKAVVALFALGALRFEAR